MKKLFTIFLLTILTIPLFAEETSPTIEKKEVPTKQNKENNEPKEESSTSKWKFGLGLSIRTGQTASSDFTITDKSNGDQATGETTLEVDPASAFDLEVRHLESFHWGFIGGFSYGGKGSITGGSITINNKTTDFSGKYSDTMAISQIFTNAAYRWNQFYIPFGLNYSFIKYQSNGGSYDAKGGIGTQMGVGYLYQNKHAFELMFNTTKYYLKYTESASDLEVEFKKGYLRSVILSWRYLF